MSSIKRARSPSPQPHDDDSKEEEGKPMVEGLTSQGFLSESHRILKKYKDNPTKADIHTEANLENAGTYIMESSGGIPGSGIIGRVQFCRTLFETVAATSNTNSFSTEEDNAKIQLLFKHALDGLKLIDGK